MTSVIIESIKPVKERLENLLLEVKNMDVKPPELSLKTKERFQLYETNGRLLEEKILRLQRCIQSIETANDKWIEHIQKFVPTTKRKEEEEKYEELTKGEKGIFKLIDEANEAIITLTIYKKEIDCESQKMTRIGSPEKKEATKYCKAAHNSALCGKRDQTHSNKTSNLNKTNEEINRNEYCSTDNEPTTITQANAVTKNRYTET
uniref:Uncharacterized protein n=1 Tax=Onchocerca volvulus TaxID=6282 RepID=A0A8R1TMD5_ONCVO